MNRDQLREAVRRKALDLGFDRVAFVPAGPCRDSGHLTEWLSAGRQAGMSWMDRTAEVRADPRRLLPGASTIVALLTFYFTEPEDSARHWVGRVSRYAWGRDYHNVLGRRLRKLSRLVAELAPDARTVTAVDHRPVLEKEWAERAGLGWIGKHTNLITSDAGSWFFLSELVTELDLAAGEKPAKERCGTCTACLEACPTGAIVAPFQVDAGRCISYLTIELDGPIPRDLRPLVGEWIFGCDVCQDVCPWNRFAGSDNDPAFRLDSGRFAGNLVDLLGMSSEEFLERFEGSPVRRAGRDGFLRNVCVALGNRRDPGTLPALGEALHDPSWLVRAHAAWALGRIGGDGAVRLLESAKPIEANPDVREEIDFARDAA